MNVKPITDAYKCNVSSFFVLFCFLKKCVALQLNGKKCFFDFISASGEKHKLGNRIYKPKLLCVCVHFHISDGRFDSHHSLDILTKRVLFLFCFTLQVKIVQNHVKISPASCVHCTTVVMIYSPFMTCTNLFDIVIR